MAMGIFPIFCIGDTSLTGWNFPLSFVRFRGGVSILNLGRTAPFFFLGGKFRLEPSILFADLLGGFLWLLRVIFWEEIFQETNI